MCAYACTYQELSVCLHVFVSAFVHLLLSVWLHEFERIKTPAIHMHLCALIGSWLVILCVGQCQELSMCTHVSACIECLACNCMCWFISGAGCKLSCVGQYQKPSVNLHVPALMKIQSWFCMCWPVSRAERVLGVFLRFESWACNR